jgi:uncharacterized protein YjbI with pentapeptide repeats
MANEKHLKILKQGVEAWNRWRKEKPKIISDLRGADFSKANLRGADFSRASLTEVDLHEADLRGATLYEANLYRAHLYEAYLTEADLRGADLRGANLSETNLSGANLYGANFRGANLSDANLYGANLYGADLRGANLGWANLSGTNLSGANLYGADLRGTNLRGANLRGADLSEARLVRTNLKKANLSGCSIYRISAWDLKLSDETKQLDLVITPHGDSIITVDNLEVAQFIYLLLTNEKIRHVIDTIGNKTVLILGRFTKERLVVLNAIREEIRKHDYLPILFDFERPASKNLTETVSTLAHMARFIIADITDAKSIPQQLERIVPHLPSVPVQPLLEGATREYGMFESFKDYPWVLDIQRYRDLDDLLASISERVIVPAEAKVKEIEDRRKQIEKELEKSGRP